MTIKRDERVVYMLGVLVPDFALCNARAVPSAVQAPMSLRTYKKHTDKHVMSERIDTCKSDGTCRSENAAGSRLSGI